MKMDEEVDKVVQILDEAGPSLSSNIADILQTELKISPVAARKRIERAKKTGVVRALEGLKFKHNEQFLFVQRQTGSKAFHSALLRALTETRSAYRLPLLGLSARGGSVPEYLFSTFSGLPIFGQKNITANDALTKLKSLDIILSRTGEVGSCVSLSQSINPAKLSDKRLIGRMFAENICLHALRDWLKLQGFAANSSTVRGKNSQVSPQFGYYQWDLVAPSYLSVMRTYASGSVDPGFIVADIILGRQLSVDDVQYFFQKCSSVKFNKNHRPFVPMLVADWFERDAFLAGRQQGAVFTTPKNLFGKNFARALDFIVQIIEGRHNPEILMVGLLESCNSITHLSSALKEMKKIVFITFAGHSYQKLRSSKVTYGGTVSDWLNANESHQIDMLFEKSDKEFTAVKCHYSENPVSIEIVDQWFRKTVPSIHLTFSDNPDVAACEYSIWSSSSFTSAARARLQQLTDDNLPYRISWKTGDEVHSLVKSSTEENIFKAFERLIKSSDDDESLLDQVLYSEYLLPNNEVENSVPHSFDFDVFICHASEDKNSVARPLAQALMDKGSKVWFDEMTLSIGDSLRRKIDEGLSKSRYGVVILSPSFFAKEWPQYELDALVSRELADAAKVILPVWYNVSAADVRQYSLALSMRLAGQVNAGIEKLASELFQIIGKEETIRVPEVSDDLSLCKQAILTLAASNDGDIFVAPASLNSGRAVVIKRYAFNDSEKQRKLFLYALQELVLAGLIEQLSETSYELTYLGIQAAERMEPLDVEIVQKLGT